jgi:hypothetical protein
MSLLLRVRVPRLGGREVTPAGPREPATDDSRPSPS